MSWCFLVPCVAQKQVKEVLLSAVDLLQYEKAKQKGGEPAAPFRKNDMKRIRASRVLEEGDKRHLWGFNVKGNSNYDKSAEPLYKLFVKEDLGSLAVIDYLTDTNRKCEVVFWGKRYYRRFSHDLRRMGFEQHNSISQTNVLEFRKDGISIGVDIIIWPEIYIMTVKAL